MKNKNFVLDAPGHFHGGVHPEEFKSISNEIPIQPLDISNTLIVPLKQQIGPSCLPLVSVGESVKAGQLIAENPMTGTRVHSPYSGIIDAIGNFAFGHPSGMPDKAIKLIKSDEQESLKLAPITNWENAKPELLLEQIKLAGIVGLGGATFPTSIKLMSKGIAKLIVNAMECEPYITCDDRLLRERAKEVIIGANISAKILGVKEVIFAIEDNKPEAIESLNQALNHCELEPSLNLTYKIIKAPTKYPSGGEKQTIELVTGEQVPSGQLPAALGIVVQNVATLFAIYDAVLNSKPLNQRVVTLTGDLMPKPGNYSIPFGTLISDIVQHFQIETSNLSNIIIGGPMMGQVTENLDTPVSKSANCIIFNSTSVEDKSWVLKAESHKACIRCSECQEVCPAALLPQQLLWFTQGEQWESLEEQGLSDCIECGACAYVCPSEIPLVQYYRFGKSEIKKNKSNKAKADKAKQRFEAREIRLQRAKKERAEKHKKAAESRKAKSDSPTETSKNKKMAINEALERVKLKKKLSTANETKEQD